MDARERCSVRARARPPRPPPGARPASASDGRARVRTSSGIIVLTSSDILATLTSTWNWSPSCDMRLTVRPSSSSSAPAPSVFFSSSACGRGARGDPTGRATLRVARVARAARASDEDLEKNRYHGGFRLYSSAWLRNCVSRRRGGRSSTDPPFRRTIWWVWLRASQSFDCGILPAYKETGLCKSFQEDEISIDEISSHCSQLVG